MQEINKNIEQTPVPFPLWLSRFHFKKESYTKETTRIFPLDKEYSVISKKKNSISYLTLSTHMK